MENDNNQSTPAKPTDSSPRHLLAGNACIFIATLFFGINIPVVKILVPHWMTAVDVTLWRILGGCVLMWIASIFIKMKPIQRHDWIKLVLGGTLGLFSFLYLFNLSLRYADPIDVSIILTLPPMFVILIGVIFMHQRPSWLEMVGVLVSFAGAFLVIIGGGSSHAGSNGLLGTLLALASTLCYAFYLVIVDGPSHTYRPVNMLRWVFLFAAVPALFFIHSMPSAPMFHSPHATQAWLLVAFIVIGPTFLSYFLVNPAVKLIGSELVSLYQYLVPVVATVASVWIGLASIHWMQVLAMVVIVAGMVCTNLGKKHRKPSPLPSKS